MDVAMKNFVKIFSKIFLNRLWIKRRAKVPLVVHLIFSFEYVQETKRYMWDYNFAYTRLIFAYLGYANSINDYCRHAQTYEWMLIEDRSFLKLLWSRVFSIFDKHFLVSILFVYFLDSKGWNRKLIVLIIQGDPF